MRTVRSSGRISGGGGVPARGGTCLGEFLVWGGVPAWGVYLPRGGVPSLGGTCPGECACLGVYLPGRVYLPRGCTWSQGVYLPGGCTWSRGVYLVLGECTWSWGVYLVRGGVPAGGCTWSWGVYLVRYSPRGQTHACKNITFATSLRTVIIGTTSTDT